MSKFSIPFIRAEPYPWPHDSVLNTTNTALVVIDMQRDCTYAIRSARYR